MKTKKPLICILISLLICIILTCSAFAVSDLPRLADDAELMTDSEQSEVLAILDEISERQKVDIVVVTKSSIGGKTAVEYADDFYDYNGYGYGEGYDGILLLVSMEERDWRISTYGYATTAFTDNGIEYISDEFLPYLQDGDYRNAFLTYAKLCDEFITQAKNATPYDGSHMPKKPFNAVTYLIVSMGIGIALSLIITGSMKGKLKSVKMQVNAENYVKANSMNITESRDMFLYSTVTRTEKPKSNSSSGGSSTHTSSSGRSHGGGGGKF